MSMTREKAKNILTSVLHTDGDYMDYLDSEDVEAIKFLASDERPHGEWIPCSERLPEEQGQYYVSGGNKVWICDFLIFSNFKGGWCNNVSNPVVEAWMPLPEPYMEEGDDK